MRILGITLPDQKQIQYGLTALYGVGPSRAAHILKEAKVPLDKKVKDLTADEEVEIRKIAEAFNLEGNLRREISHNIKRLKDINSYRGSRHAHGLPAHGQRTKTNSRTLRGNKRMTMGSGRRKESKT